MDMDNIQGINMGSLKISECEVCAKNQAKYTCPRCELRTCSLECVKIHKRELDCNGLRDKVKFKNIKKMDNFDLLSDYRLLEETSRLVQKSVKLPPISCTSPINGSLPTDLFRFKCATSKRGVQIYFLPPNFTRHITNTSCLDHKTQDLYWRVDWVFSQADNALLTDERILDTTILSVSVYKYLDSEDTMIPSLSFYQAAGLSGIKLLLKAEKTAPNRYFLLDPTLSFRDNLRGKSIIEYPVIHVVLSEHVYMFNIFSEEEEEELIKRQRRRQYLYKKNHSGSKTGFVKQNDFEGRNDDTGEDNVSVEGENFNGDNVSQVRNGFKRRHQRKKQFGRPYFKNNPGHNRSGSTGVQPNSDFLPRCGPNSEIDY